MIQNSLVGKVTTWLASHSLILLIMALFAALQGMAFWGYVLLLVVAITCLVLYMPVVGLLQDHFYPRDVIVKHIERFLLNAIWIGVASYVLMLVFQTETRPLLLIILHVVTMSLLLTFYPLMLIKAMPFKQKGNRPYEKHDHSF